MAAYRDGTTLPSVRHCFNVRLDNQFVALKKVENNLAFYNVCLDLYPAVIDGTTSGTGFVYNNGTSNVTLEGFTTPASSGLAANIDLIDLASTRGCGGTSPPTAVHNGPVRTACSAFLRHHA